MLKEKMRSSEGKIERKVFYAQAVYGEEEKRAVLKSLENPWLASGPLVKEFEGKVAGFFGKKHAIAVNSGSSANLLALGALRMPKGSEVITPACTFSTTVSTIIQNELVPVFVDSVIGRYVMDEELVEPAITEKTKAIMTPHLIGGVSDLARLREIADKYGLYLIDDSCDTIAPQFGGEPIARFSDIATTSFYGSHIITAMGYGGMIMTDSEELRERVMLKRDWGRGGGDEEDFEKRFACSIDGIPYDSKFLYNDLGYNLKLNEGAAAFGLEQLNRLPGFLETRRRNFEDLRAHFGQYEEFFYLPELIPGAETNWLAFPLTIREGAPFDRHAILKHLESKGIQTRVLFSGNITRHPVYRDLPLRIASRLDNADHIMANGFLLGCHQGMRVEDAAYIMRMAQEFLQYV